MFKPELMGVFDKKFSTHVIIVRSGGGQERSRAACRAFHNGGGSLCRVNPARPCLFHFTYFIHVLNHDFNGEMLSLVGGFNGTSFRGCRRGITH